MKNRRMNRVRVMLAAAALAVAAIVLPRSAHAVDVLASAGLPKPERLREVADQIGLTADQQAEIEKTMSAAREEASPLEQAVREQQDAFAAALRNPKVTTAQAEAALTKLLDAEAAVKRLQVKTLLKVRQQLTGDQLTKLNAMAAKTEPAREIKNADDLPPAMAAKVKRLKTAIESLGISPTEVLKSRGADIEQLVKDGKLDAADAAIDKLIVDTKLADFEAKPAQAIDFSKVAPGDTDIPTLQRRLEQVTERAKGIIALPLLRDLIKAKEALEDAKGRQDAEAVGRILTWAEKATAQ